MLNAYSINRKFTSHNIEYHSTFLNVISCQNSGYIIGTSKSICKKKQCGTIAAVYVWCKVIIIKSRSQYISKG